MPRKLLSAAIVSASLFLVFILILPKYEQVKDLRSAVQAREEVVKDKTAILSNIKNLGNQIDSRASEINKLSKILPVKNRVDEIVSSMETISSQTGMELRDIAIAEQPDEKIATSLIAQINP